MAIITLYYSVNGILNVCAKAKNIQVVANNKNMVLFGFLAGVIGGSTNAMSPILLIFLLSETEDKNRIAKASNLCYLLAKIVQIYMLKDQYWLLNKSEYGLIFLLSVLSIIGLYAGIWLRAKISPNFFKMLIFIVLLVLALKIGHSGLIKL